MLIYEVFSNSQGYDGDGWDHWAFINHVSYHLTKEGAEARVKSLLEHELSLQKSYKASRKSEDTRYVPAINVETNTTLITTGTGMEREQEEFTAIDIRTVAVED